MGLNKGSSVGGDGSRSVDVARPKDAKDSGAIGFDGILVNQGGRCTARWSGMTGLNVGMGSSAACC